MTLSTGRVIVIGNGSFRLKTKGMLYTGRKPRCESESKRQSTEVRVVRSATVPSRYAQLSGLSERVPAGLSISLPTSPQRDHRVRDLLP